jgi:hypothetical protein
MIGIVVHSQNLRGSLKRSIDNVLTTINDPDCECTAFLLQDLGTTGPEGPSALRNYLGEHKILVNSATSNKSRTVGIIIHKSWKIMKIFKDDTGSLIGAEITKGSLSILVVSAYLPTSLDNYGAPDAWNSESQKTTNLIQKEAHAIYSTLLEWTHNNPTWIIGGDLNETREDLDRVRTRKFKARPYKFINNFLEESGGIDVWRQLFPHLPGFTYCRKSKVNNALKQNEEKMKKGRTGKNGDSFSRLDYFLASKHLQTKARMSLGNWEPGKDHVRITLNIQLQGGGHKNKNLSTHPWSIHQPMLSSASPQQLVESKEQTNLELTVIMEKMNEALRSSTNKLKTADEFSIEIARSIVEIVGSIVGFKKSTHRKGRYESLEVVKSKAEIKTIMEARDLIRTLYFNEYETIESKKEIETHLHVLLDRLCRMGLASVPRELDIESLHEWSESLAPFDINNIRSYIEVRKEDMMSIEKKEQARLFCDPRKRGKWLERIFGSHPVACPNYAIDSESGRQTSDPDEVKSIYLKEGAHILKNKLPCPPSFDEKECIASEPPPNPSCRANAPPKQKPHMLPRWWKSMYERNAKGIDGDMWTTLMKPTNWNEVREVISESEKEKAAGYDGVCIDLIKLLTEDSTNEPSPLLSLLTSLINIAFEYGETLTSWRKAIISMIPKKKDDGSYTKMVSEMRPISVLQEFGKISSKILAKRLGLILLENPELLTRAQRAFLKDGCTAQCINTALNILEDFKDKKKKKPQSQLFMLAYDQVKAYDSVQSYTIRASLERFNFPESFITYCLSNLENATSCFKTFYGPTEDFAIETSVRQGDPLSPLIYICVTDALHEGLKCNPLYGNRPMGYSFTNDPVLRIASCGYADDTLTFSESWRDQWMMHEWVRDFCHAHGFKINAHKSRYIISDCLVDNDPRWLSSVDGTEKIVPLPSSTHFRYLGLWMSMDLDWTKQTQMLNKLVMDWRWRAHAAKADPAQLKSSVMEYLLPRMEIGLNHASITQKMCDAWLSTIIHTLCDRGGMKTASTINKKAFCLLAGLPDIWMRLQTSRAAELLVNLNTKHCLSGRSTRARFFSLCDVSVGESKDAIQQLRNATIYKRKNLRISSTIQYLKSLNINFAVKSEGDQGPLHLANELAQILKKAHSSGQVDSAIAYTDGSTNVRSKTRNSGCGIFITDETNVPIWKGGLWVRSDGNNFIPEVAAASILIKACPDKLPLILNMDSKAAIGAISQGPLSERKRVRAAGRPWLNFSRTEFREKRNHIHLRHVRSHMGGITDDDKGNDTADTLANEYRRQATERVIPYFMYAEEHFILQHDGNNIQGDARSYIKKLEQNLMLKIVKRDAPKQSNLIEKFPRQILLQAERVWKWSIQAGDGKAWLYYIFAACQWLPTNHRLYYKDKSGYRRDKCPLCLSSGVDDMAHMLLCPALQDVQNDLRTSVQSKLEELRFPFSDKKVVPLEKKRKEVWFRNTRATIADTISPGIDEAISSESLMELIEDYCRTNNHKQFVSYKKFLTNLRSLLRRFACQCTLNDTCKLRKCAVLHEDLVRVIYKHLRLSTEYGTDPLHRTRLISEWSSFEQEDAKFGAQVLEGKTNEAKLFKQDLSGKNVLMIFHRIWDENKSTCKYFWEELERQISSKEPTRMLVVVPSQYMEPLVEKKRCGFLELARIEKHFPFKSPESFQSPVLPVHTSQVLIASPLY